MHLSEEQIQRFLHGELDPVAQETLSRHVAGCDECARALARAEREEDAIFELLRQVDHPVPRLDARAFAPRVDADALAPSRRALATWGRRAAGFALAVALAGAAYAIPGSPLPALVKKVAQLVTGGDEAPAPSGDSSNERRVTSGIAVAAGESFTIAFSDEQTRGAVAFSLIDGPNAVVRVIGGNATFTTDAGRLTIDNRGAAADYEIDIPRHVMHLEIQVAGRVVMRKEGDRFAAELPEDAAGRRLLSLSPEP